MVVIEPVATGEDSSNEQIPVTEPVKYHTSSSTATNMEDDSLRGGDAGYTSDGFETASETEFNDEGGRKEGERDIEKSNEGLDFKVSTEASSKDKEEQQCREQNLELEENKEEVIMCIPLVYGLNFFSSIFLSFYLFIFSDGFGTFYGGNFTNYMLLDIFICSKIVMVIRNYPLDFEF